MAILDSHSIGDTLSIQYTARERIYHKKLALVENPRLIIVTNESQGMPVTPAMKQFRQSWLGNKIHEKSIN